MRVQLRLLPTLLTESIRTFDRCPAVICDTHRTAKDIASLHIYDPVCRELQHISIIRVATLRYSVDLQVNCDIWSLFSRSN